MALDRSRWVELNNEQLDQFFQRNVKGHAPVSEDAGSGTEDASNLNTTSEQVTGDGLCAPPCSLVRSLLADRSHTKDYPTTLNGSTEKSDGRIILEFKVQVPVSKEEKEEVDKHLWGRKIVITDHHLEILG